MPWAQRGCQGSCRGDRWRVGPGGPGVEPGSTDATADSAAGVHRGRSTKVASTRITLTSAMMLTTERGVHGLRAGSKQKHRRRPFPRVSDAGLTDPRCATVVHTCNLARHKVPGPLWCLPKAAISGVQGAGVSAGCGGSACADRAIGVVFPAPRVRTVGVVHGLCLISRFRLAKALR
jgi:hypothetical protein